MQKIYLEPPDAAEQAIRITKRQLWGRCLQEGHNGNDHFDLPISLLRKIALPAIQSEG